MNAMIPRILKWHRKLALIAASAFFLWSGSGLLHPVMTWTNPHPAAFMSPAAPEFRMPPVSAIKNALHKSNIPVIESLRVLSSEHIQVALPGQPERVYIDLKSGAVIPGADSSRALSLARYYSGATEPVRNITPVTKFSNAYPYINRFLPAWRVDFDRPDGLSLYVETQTDRLGSITNNRKFILQTIFQNVHTWSFLNSAEGLRVGVIFCLVASIIGMAGMGMAILLFLKRPNGVNGHRRRHRWIAIIAWLPLIVFPVSGLFHLVVQSSLFYADEKEQRPQLSANAIPQPPAGTGRGASLLLMPDGSPYWWTPGMKDDDLTTKLARQFSGEPGLVSLTEIKTFSSEYAFAYKRLPVWRAKFKNGVYFVEPSTATLAAKTSGLRTAENLIFSNLHKWQFLEPYMGRIGRDILMITVIMTGMLMTMTGLMIKLKKRK